MELLSRMILLVFIIFIAPQSFAYNPSEGNVTATFGPYFYKTNFEGSSSGAESPFLGGFGLIAVGDVSERGSLEIAMFYQHKLFFREKDGLFLAEKTKIVHITMGYRWWLSPYFSTALAFYSSYPMGDPKIIHSDYAPGAEIDTSARDNTEYGFDFSVDQELWTDGNIALVANGRYSKSVTSKDHESADDYGVLLGIRYLVQGTP